MLVLQKNSIKNPKAVLEKNSLKNPSCSLKRTPERAYVEAGKKKSQKKSR